MENKQNKGYIIKRKKLSGLLFEKALPNEYLIEVGRPKFKPLLGGKKFKLYHILYNKPIISKKYI